MMKLKIPGHCFLLFSLMLMNVHSSVCEEPQCGGTDNGNLLLELKKIESNTESMRRDIGKLVETMVSIQTKGSSTDTPCGTGSVDSDGWELIFRATAGNSDNVYDAWISGKSTTPTKPLDMERSFSSHFRSSKINNWRSQTIKYVKYALYELGKEVAFIMFDGSGTNNMNWFSKTRIINSSWHDLTSEANYNYFSLIGHLERGRLDRRFFINNNYGGCDVDKGTAMTLDTTERNGPCKFDKQSSFPQFLYSKITTADRWNTLMFGRADFLAIFINT